MTDEARAALEEAYDAAVAEMEEDTVEETTEDETTAESEEVIDAAESESGVETESESEEETATDDAVESEAAGDGDEPDRDDASSEAAAPVAGKPPASWGPQAREVWADLPDTARAEIEKREAEISAKLNETTEERAMLNRFNQAVAPFQQTIAMEAGGDPIRAAANLMGVATRLRMGTTVEKAETVRAIIDTYGIDLQALANALDAAPGSQPGGVPPTSPGYPAAPGAAVPPPPADPRVDQMWQSQMSERQAEVERFMSDPEHEFANDVRNDMADLMLFHAQRGRDLTMKEAYDQAVAMRPDIQAVIAQRGAAPAAPAPVTNASDLARKKRAAKSIQGAPARSNAPADDGAPRSRSASIADAWDKVEGGD